MEDNGKYTGRTSRFWGVICALIFLLYIFRSLIGDFIINSPIGSSICKIKVFSSCYKIKGLRIKGLRTIKRNRHLMTPDQQRLKNLLQGPQRQNFMEPHNIRQKQKLNRKSSKWRMEQNRNKTPKTNPIISCE